MTKKTAKPAKTKVRDLKPTKSSAVKGGVTKKVSGRKLQ